MHDFGMRPKLLHGIVVNVDGLPCTDGELVICLPSDIVSLVHEQDITPCPPHLVALVCAEKLNIRPVGELISEQSAVV